MRILYVLISSLLIISCTSSNRFTTKKKPLGHKSFSSVNVQIIAENSSSIRALSVKNDLIAYAGSGGHYGTLKFKIDKIASNPDIAISENFQDVLVYSELSPSFRSVALTTNYMFFTSIANPTLLYKLNLKTKKLELVYTEEHEKVFYDSMSFWNDKEGIVIGDPINDCLSILITRDGGESWNKIACNSLPEGIDGEAAFAASDTNIKIIGNHTWIVSGGKASRVFYSSDRGVSWEVFDTPIIQGSPTQGAYSMDFYNSKVGIIYGGDYTSPQSSIANIATTTDGGKTWKIKASGSNGGYKSCVQFVPNSNAKGIVALGFTGISYSENGGDSWTNLSSDKFLSFRFINDSVAIAAGNNKIARLDFRYK